RSASDRSSVARIAPRSSGLGSGLISGSTGRTLAHRQSVSKGRRSRGRYDHWMRRPLVLAACCLFLAAPPALATTAADGSFGPASRKQGSVVPPKSWDKAEIRLVVAHGLM